VSIVITSPVVGRISGLNAPNGANISHQESAMPFGLPHACAMA